MMRAILGSWSVGLALLAVACAAGNAQANLVFNGGFELYNTANFNPPTKEYFHVAQPTGWTYSPQRLAFLCAPGTADDGSYLSVWGPFPATSPAGGNFVMSDGDPFYSGAISQMLHGLVANQTYEVSFYQAAGQQVNFNGPTTEQWRVTLGTQTQFSTLFSLPQHGVGPWQKETMQFTPAVGGSLLLEFFAVGTPGGAPPICFLDGVSVTAVPEPGSLLILGIGMLVLPIVRKLRAKSAAV